MASTRTLFRLSAPLRAPTGHVAPDLGARPFASRHVETVVAAGSNCTSACAIAFLGGSVTEEQGASVPRRALVAGGILGFHAPALGLPEGELAWAPVAAAYGAAVKTIAAIASNASDLGPRGSLLPRLPSASAEQPNRIGTVDDLGAFGMAMTCPPLRGRSPNRWPSISSATVSAGVATRRRQTKRAARTL